MNCTEKNYNHFRCHLRLPQKTFFGHTKEKNAFHLETFINKYDMGICHVLLWGCPSLLASKLISGNLLRKSAYESCVPKVSYGHY